MHIKCAKIGGNNHNLLASEEVYYTNDNGLSLTYNEYVKLNEIVSDSFIDYLTEDEYEYLSMNIVDDVSSSLKCEFSVTFGTGVNDFDVYDKTPGLHICGDIDDYLD